MPIPSTRILSWRQIVQDADPGFQNGLMRPWIYQFSNGRLFVAVPQVASAGGPFLTDDQGNILLDNNGNPILVSQSVGMFLTNDLGQVLTDNNGNPVLAG